MSYNIGWLSNIAVVVNLKDTYVKGMNISEVQRVSMGTWKRRVKTLNRAKILLAQFEGVVVGQFYIDAIHPAGTLQNCVDKPIKGRVQFSLRPVITNNIIGQHIGSHQNPCVGPR